MGKNHAATFRMRFAYCTILWQGKRCICGKNLIALVQAPSEMDAAKLKARCRRLSLHKNWAVLIQFTISMSSPEGRSLKEYINNFQNG